MKIHCNAKLLLLAVSAVQLVGKSTKSVTAAHWNAILQRAAQRCAVAS